MGPVIAIASIIAIIVVVVIICATSDGEGAFFLADELSTRPHTPRPPCERCPWAD